MNQPKQQPIVFIDGLNIFLRHFCANPTVTPTGELVGGVVGFLRFVEWIVSNMSPQRIYVVWEKGGGCARRKSIYPQYKENRARIDGLEGAMKVDTGRIMDNHESKQKQLVMLVELLKYLPVCQIYHPECECDDVLAYMVKDKFRDSDVQKIVISSDKDFYQLLTRDDIIIYDQSKKTYITPKDVVDKFGIHPRNFVLARTIDGDNSDNIDGVKGIGFKTLLKVLPEIGDQEKEYDVSTLMETCRQKLTEKPNLKALQNIAENENIIRRNWQLMYLGVLALNANQIIKINDTIEKFKPRYEKLNFLKTLQKFDIPASGNFDFFEQKMKICLLSSL